jgi:(1->4)-alpha-D-glucan 1-alpha-D-glucosylmutase
MGPYPDNPFLKDFLPFQKKISLYGMLNSLSQALLKITSPGVADFYQGTELWDFSLVDPDNRRPVDYGKRIAMLEEIKRREAEAGPLELIKDLLMNKDDGRIKMYLTYRALNYRKANRELFEKGEYAPIEAFGERANNICTFSRRLFNEAVIVAVPRLLAGIEPDADLVPLGEKTWGGSYIADPGAGVGLRYRNIFTGEEIEVKKHEEQSVLYLSNVFANFPAALLEAVKVS